MGVLHILGGDYFGINLNHPLDFEREVNEQPKINKLKNAIDHMIIVVFRNRCLELISFLLELH